MFDKWKSINKLAEAFSFLILDFKLLVLSEHNPHLEINIKIIEVNI